MTDLNILEGWISELLWHWDGDTPLSGEAISIEIMAAFDLLQKHDAPHSALQLPDALEFLRYLEKNASHTEKALLHEYLNRAEA